MRITKSEGYHHGLVCQRLWDCESHYCHEHRLLWSDCETMRRGFEGDRDVAGGLHAVFEMGNCPSCERELYVRRNRHAQMP